MDAKGKKNNWKGSPSKNNEGQNFLEQLWQGIVWINVPLKDEIVQERLWRLVCFFCSVYATVCPWSVSRYMQHFSLTWGWKMLMGSWAVSWSAPPSSYHCQLQKRGAQGIKLWQHTCSFSFIRRCICLFRISADWHGCCFALWVLCSSECQSNTCWDRWVE